LRKNHEETDKNDFPSHIESPTEKYVGQYSRYTRSSLIRSLCYQRADGICELCKQNAPFFDKYNRPYLEVHHVISLSKNGKDSSSNVIALCPNCHRKFHYGSLNSDESKKVLELITKYL
jgi:5-methylcytosine-specific restriction enzyme A